MNIHTARLATRTLAGIGAGLLLLAIVQYAGLGRGHHWLPEYDASDEPALGQVDRETFKMPPAATFAEVERRPLFNSDRKPTPEGEGIGEVADAAAEEPPPSPLNIALTGIILSGDTEPETRIALIHDNARNQSLALKVGMPLEGPQGGWTLTEIHERSVVFTSLADESSEVELETGASPSNPASRRPSRAAQGSAGKGKAGDEKSDLAERIEQRRQQMRERAEDLREKRESNQRKPKEN